MIATRFKIGTNASEPESPNRSNADSASDDGVSSDLPEQCTAHEKSLRERVTVKEYQGEGSDCIVKGFVKPGWEPVADAFVANFAERGEVGASVCVSQNGETKVDLWGGWADRSAERAWERDTIVVVFSCSKGATATMAHILIDRGLLDPAAPVSEYWPEFSRAGKASATVAMMLNHSVGVPGFRDPLPHRSIADWDYMIHRLEEEEPFWEPGIRNGYHALTFGWTVGELIRRISGKSLGTFFADEVAQPLGLDFWFGLPENLEPRVAPIIPAGAEALEGQPGFIAAATCDPKSPSALTMINSGGFSSFEEIEGKSVFGPNSRWLHASEIGAGGAITNARGLAGLYQPLAALDDSLLSIAQKSNMAKVSMATMKDAVLLLPTRFTLGFMAPMDNRDAPVGHNFSLLLPEGTFGHVGAGGSLGFADPALGLSFGYAMNRMGSGILLNQRGQSLVDATYRCAKFESRIISGKRARSL